VHKKPLLDNILSTLGPQDLSSLALTSWGMKKLFGSSKIWANVKTPVTSEVTVEYRIKIDPRPKRTDKTDPNQQNKETAKPENKQDSTQNKSEASKPAEPTKQGSDKKEVPKEESTTDSSKKEETKDESSKDCND